MHKIDLMPPIIRGQKVTFQWNVEPQTKLYKQTQFAIQFPSFVDLTRVPERLWWDLLIMCLHPHWLLLRPCKIHLPLKLGNSLKQFWLQMLQNGADTLDFYGPPKNLAPLGITIVDGNLDVPYAAVVGSGYGTAFSGGKDSLLQAALLFELTERPLLVATTSPMPPLADHTTARRRWVFESIQKRRNPVFVESVSDFRHAWDNSFAGELGFRVAVNELTDTFLYTSCLLAAGAALGFTHLFVASETELQETALIDGKIVQHSHFMYSAATQRALAQLFAPYCLSFGSLTWPLHTMQVQQLLWRRYPDLCDLQYSCWRVGESEETCSQCEQCLRIATTALEMGADPQHMGVDLRKLTKFASTWEPTTSRFSSYCLPQDDAADLLGARVVQAIRNTSLVHVGRIVARRRNGRFAPFSALKTVWRFYRLSRRFRHSPTPPRMGVREGFFDWLDEDLRDALMAIYKSYFPVEPKHEHRSTYERSFALTERAVSSLN
jgi:hypothetical protein